MPAPTPGLRLATVLATLAVAACGGAQDGSKVSAPQASEPIASVADDAAERAHDSAMRAPRAASMTARDAVRLADQATFGATESLLSELRSIGPVAWLSNQLRLDVSRYRSGGDDAIHRNVQVTSFCDQLATGRATCWRDWYSATPLTWDFYRNAVHNPDQLRQRMALALQQLLVVSGVEVHGTYGLRNYQNMLLSNAFGNYRDVLRHVAMSPVMGDYLNNANNDKAAPNENFARELLQLFSIGTCELNTDGELRGGSCTPTYDNNLVRNYAHALTGWTYPAGGITAWGCWPAGLNCVYYGGPMKPAPAFHDDQSRPLLSGRTKPVGSTPASALEVVLDSVMAHPNVAPFIAKRLIQSFVAGDPSPAYVERVAAAFASGRLTVASGTSTSAGLNLPQRSQTGTTTFGTGLRGDLAATVAAILLDPEARGDNPPASNAGRLREPVQLMTGLLRALHGSTDGDALGWWGEALGQPVFSSPTVFNFYPPDYPVAGTPLIGPVFGILNANTGVARLNFMVAMLEWGGAAPAADVPGAIGSRVKLNAFVADASDASRLVDRLSNLAFGGALAAGPRSAVIRAVESWTPSSHPDSWQLSRVHTAAYLVFASPDYQIQR
jgi:uncharacterized protein (DUF1800 family)